MTPAGINWIGFHEGILLPTPGQTLRTTVKRKCQSWEVKVSIPLVRAILGRCGRATHWFSLLSGSNTVNRWHRLTDYVLAPATQWIPSADLRNRIRMASCARPCIAKSERGYPRSSLELAAGERRNRNAAIPAG